MSQNSHALYPVTALRRAAANRKSNPVEARSDDGALCRVRSGYSRDVDPAQLGLRAVVGAQELPGQPTGQCKSCSRKEWLVAYELQSWPPERNCLPATDPTGVGPAPAAEFPYHPNSTTGLRNVYLWPRSNVYEGKLFAPVGFIDTNLPGRREEGILQGPVSLALESACRLCRIAASAVPNGKLPIR